MREEMQNRNRYNDNYGDINSRGEDVHYSERNDLSPKVPSFPVPYANDSSRAGQLAGFRYGDRVEDITRYGRVDWYSVHGLPTPGFRERREPYSLDGSQHSNRGKGPKSYKRSDERILEDICQRLTDNRYLDASEIEVNMKSGDVLLKGYVEGRYEKRLAEDLGETVYGVTNVENRLKIKSK